MPRRQVRYAVVGLGHIAQVAVLPAFGNARRNSRLAALVSDDPVKLEELGAKYHVERRYSYARYDAMPEERRGRRRVHRAAEQPAPRIRDARGPGRGARPVREADGGHRGGVRAHDRARRDEAGVKLMVAYRLHFERANLEAIEVVALGAHRRAAHLQLHLHDARCSDRQHPRSTTGARRRHPVRHRHLLHQRGARPVPRRADGGVRVSGHDGDALPRGRGDCRRGLRFPGERLATFTCSFGAADVSEYRVVGTKGDLASSRRTSTPWRCSSVLTIDGERSERATSRSATSSRPSCCTSPTACSTATSPSRVRRKASPTCA